MSQSKWMTCGSMAVLSVALAAPAWAQATSAAAGPGADGSGLEEIVVTARRVEEKELKVPVAITAVTPAALAQRNVEQVSDLQFSVPNLQIKQNNTYSSLSEFIIRGQRQTLFTDENTVTYVNGVPQSPRGLTLYDLDSVQVLKGPQGTLFGKNSDGGAVIVTTKKPQFDYEGQIDLDVGNYNLVRATGILNAPIVDEKLAVRFDGQIERRDGVFQNSYPGGQDADNRDNESGRLTILARPIDALESLTTVDGIHRNEFPTPSIIQSAPTNNTGVGALFALLTQQAVAQQSALGGGTPILVGNQFTRQGDPYFIRMPTGTSTTVPAGRYNPITGLGSRVDVWGVTNNTSYDINDALTLRNIVSYRYERAIDTQDPAGVAGFTLNIAPVLTAFGVPGLPSYVPGQFVDNNTIYFNLYKTVTEEVQLIGNLPHTKFIVGGFYSHADHTYAVTSSLTIGPVDLYQIGPRYGGDEITTSSKAIFGQTTYDFGEFGLDDLSLTLGGRLTWDERDYVATNFYTAGDQTTNQHFQGGHDFCNELNGAGLSGTGVNTPTQCILYGGKTYYAPTWTISLDYQIDPDTMVYVTSRRGFKAGSSNPTTVNHDFAMFGPEYLYDYEIGLKTQGRVADIPYRFSIDGFWGLYKDIQTGDILTFCATPSCSATYTDLDIFNVGRATIEGIELELAAKPMPQLELNLGYSYQYATFGDGSIIPQPTKPGPVSPSNPIDFSHGQSLAGESFPGVPRHDLTVAATYHMDFIPSSFADVALNMNYAWRSATTGNQAIGVAGTPAYGVANMRLSLDNLFESSFSAALWVSNIADNAYPLSCNDNSASLAFTTCRWGEPQTYGVTLRYKFGEAKEAPPEPATYTPPPVQAPAAVAHSYMVFFDFNKSDLTSDAVKIVDQAASNAGPAKATELVVTGHTDTVGSDAYNLRLGQRRAQSVAAQLEKDGIPAAEIQIVSKGKRDLLVPTKDGVREPQNRRVTIVYSGGPTS